MEWFMPIVMQARAGHPDSAAALFARSKLVKLYGDTAAQKTVTKLIMDNTRVWTDTVRPPSAPLTPPALARLDSITSPVLVLLGAHDSRDAHAIADTIVAGVKRGRLIVFPNAGHVLNIDQPVRFDSALVGFLGPTGTP